MLTNIIMPAAGEGLFGLGLGIGVPSVTLLLKVSVAYSECWRSLL